jgi:hypothetical protein
MMMAETSEICGMKCTNCDRERSISPFDISTIDDIGIPLETQKIKLFQLLLGACDDCRKDLVDFAIKLNRAFSAEKWRDIKWDQNQ